MTAPGQADEPWKEHVWPCVLFYTSAWEPSGKPSARRACTCSKGSPGQADEYTPPEEQVRHRPTLRLPHGQREAGGREFDRFLAARDRAVREAVLEEAAQIVYTLTCGQDGCAQPGCNELHEAMAAIRAAANQTGEQKHED